MYAQAVAVWGEPLRRRRSDRGGSSAMAKIAIDADAMFRAFTALGYKMIVYYLDRNTGAVVPRQTERRVEYKPRELPKLDQEAERPKPASPFAEVPLPAGRKDLFGDGIPQQRRDPFSGDFWKKPEKPKLNLFGDGPARPIGPPKGPLFKDPPPVESNAARSDGAAPGGIVAPTADEAPEELEGGRLLLIRPVPEKTQYEWMAEFAKDCGDPEIRDRLREAMAGAKEPHRGFFSVLSRYGRLRDQWERFYRRKALDRAEEWLRQKGIEYVLVEARPTDRVL
jgi:hypothetical protein